MINEKVISIPEFHNNFNNTANSRHSNYEHDDCGGEQLNEAGKSTQTIHPCIYPCCLKEFDNKWSLIRHAKSHTGERPYKCNTCEKSFAQKCSLKRHQQTHLKDKRWICSHQNCAKQFKLKEYLDAHVRTHIQLQPESVSEQRDSDLSASTIAADIM